jgi:hypothetical protein
MMEAGVLCWLEGGGCIMSYGEHQDFGFLSVEDNAQRSGNLLESLDEDR